MKKSKDLNSKQALAEIAKIEALGDLSLFISDDEDRKTVLKASDEKRKSLETLEEDSEEPAITIESIVPEPKEVDKTPVGNGRVRFVSNGSNLKLGVEGTVKHPAEATARLFANNGWGTIE